MKIEVNSSMLSAVTMVPNPRSIDSGKSLSPMVKEPLKPSLRLDDI